MYTPDHISCMRKIRKHKNLIMKFRNETKTFITYIHEPKSLCEIQENSWEFFKWLHPSFIIEMIWTTKRIKRGYKYTLKQQYASAYCSVLTRWIWYEWLCNYRAQKKWGTFTLIRSSGGCFITLLYCLHNLVSFCSGMTYGALGLWCWSLCLGLLMCFRYLIVRGLWSNNSWKDGEVQL